MNEIAETLIEGLLERESEVGGKVTWAGQCLPCSGGESREGKSLVVGGFRFNAAAVIVLRLATLSPDFGRPAPKHLVSYVSESGAPPRQLLIDTVSTLYNAILVLECNDPNQGA